MNFGFEINPLDVLGVAHDASLAEIHEAFRVKSKKHHPDLGGDEWAFRVVTRSYEILSNRRVQQRFAVTNPDYVHPPTTREPEPRASWFQAKEAPRSPEPEAPKEQRQSPAEWVREGVQDKQVAISKKVDVELFTLRYELEGPLDFLSAPENRNLSCCLTATWPSPEHPEIDPNSREAEATLKVLKKVFETVARKTRAVDSWSRVTDGRFVGWLNYPTAIKAYQGFENFHESLLAKGLGTSQRTREMFLTRERG